MPGRVFKSEMAALHVGARCIIYVDADDEPPGAAPVGAWIGRIVRILDDGIWNKLFPVQHVETEIERSVLDATRVETDRGGWPEGAGWHLKPEHDVRPVTQKAPTGDYWVMPDTPSARFLLSRISTSEALRRLERCPDSAAHDASDRE
jgi:hypothetical protein